MWVIITDKYDTIERSSRIEYFERKGIRFYWCVIINKLKGYKVWTVKIK